MGSIRNPSVPYVGPISGQVGPGFCITIRGTTHQNCNRFAINLQCGPNICPRDDVILHFGVDFIRQCVIRNSIHNNSWGPEELQQQSVQFPFVRGSHFTLMIVVGETGFDLFINNDYFASFEHRIVYHRATHLAIDGDVTIDNIEFIRQAPHGSGSYPAAIYPPMMPSSAPGSNSFCIHPQRQPPPPYPATPGMPVPAPYTSSMLGNYPLPPYNNAVVAPGVMAGGMGVYPPPISSNAQAHPHNYNPGHYGNNGVGNMIHGPHQSNPSTPHHGSAGHHNQGQGIMGGLLNKIGAGGVAATAATAATGGLALLGGKKAWKAQKKARKNALKFGIPLAGAGIGAYALSKAWSSSSSSSSSDEE